MDVPGEPPSEILPWLPPTARITRYTERRDKSAMLIRKVKKHSFSTGIRDTAGLFPVASRFNHSCRPGDNVEYAFDPDKQTLEMVVKAESIRAGRS